MSGVSGHRLVLDRSAVAGWTATARPGDRVLYFARPSEYRDRAIVPIDHPAVTAALAAVEEGS